MEQKNPSHLLSKFAKRESQCMSREGPVPRCVLELSLDKANLREKHPFIKALLNYVLYSFSVMFFQNNINEKTVHRCNYHSTCNDMILLSIRGQIKVIQR